MVADHHRVATPHDPTLCSPDLRSEIESYYGVQIEQADPAQLKHVVDSSKSAGNKAFKEKRYREAVTWYSQAIAGAPLDHSLFGNRSAAHLALDEPDAALLDAKKAVKLKGTWPKGYYRLGMACLALAEWGLAEQAFVKGLDLGPENREMAAKLKITQQELAHEQAAEKALKAMHRRDLVIKLREARKQDLQLTMLNQFKQSMAGPDWEIEDYEWRPTHLPSMRLRPLDKVKVFRDPRKRMLADYVNALADLAHPKMALTILHDEARVLSYERAIQEAVTMHQGKRVLILSAGTGLLGMLAAASGAPEVICIERSRFLYRMAKQALQANPNLQSRIILVGRRLQACGVEGQGLPPEIAKALAQLAIAAGAQDSTLPSARGATQTVPGLDDPAAATLQRQQIIDSAQMLPGRADLLITDLLDHSVLGMGLLPAVDYASQHLLNPGATIVPNTLEVWAVLVSVQLEEVAGFDLSYLNRYRWHPQSERVDLSRLPHTRLSAPFRALALDLQLRVDAISTLSAEGKDPQTDSTGWETDECLTVSISRAGTWTGIAFWFQASLHGQHAVHSGPPGAASGAAATSWQQSLQYIDKLPVLLGECVELRVRQDQGQIVFTSNPVPRRARHAYLPRWHFDMLLDHQRNQAYQQAIERAIELRRASGCQQVHVLDVGAGSGLLSMMAARAGADSVIGAEMSQHMCDVGAETVVMNGYADKCILVNKDVRRMDVAQKPDGTPPDMTNKADVLVFEVFDSGLIGEGVLHSVAWAKARLLQPDAVLVPSAASVFCQPIQMRTGNVRGLDFEQANMWRWRADYEGIDLALQRDSWLPLGKPQEVMGFDFYEAQANMEPLQVPVELPVDAVGICNAIAFWFELHLDEETNLSTSPYSEKGATWQQAVQWVEERRVDEGDVLEVTASHDTYSISFALSPQDAPAQPTQDGLQDLDTAGPAPASTAVPLKDAAWEASHKQLAEVNGQLAKACIQNPLEYRTTALAAVQFAARPHDLDIDNQQAVHFCTQMMG
ncbi:hypothetical protein WJX84_003683 [Apatococcus fuscideae]|uniref:Protein arginine N-methyltransferase domain-containing protein n=1 Tax=Apatococcus fuscideae TaxID=2026836 RepID=A0AAW1T5Q4_9CHLO